MQKTNCQEPIIVNNLSKTFRGKLGRRVVALDNVSFNVGGGEIFGFLGPNGAGKSTTIKTLMGLIRPGSGAAFLCGSSVGLVASRQYVGYLPENPAFFDYLTGREYLSFVAKAFSSCDNAASTTIDTWLERLNLADAASRQIRGYSKGMVQRLGLAQALLHNPDVVILDEPMSGLDPQGRALVKEVIVELKNAGKTVFFSTHITADVEKICDRLAIIVNGRLCADASVDDILREGVSGYRIIARGDRIDKLQPGSVQHESAGTVEYCVDVTEMPKLVSSITSSGGMIEVVEPLRRDLEEYFLEIVKQAVS